MRRTLRLVVVAVVATLGALTLTSPASAASPYCGLVWGSGPESGSVTAPTGASLNRVRAGQHACYDRLVISLTNGSSALAYTVRYGPVTGVGSGDRIPVSGGASLVISIQADGKDYTVTDPRHVVPVSGYRTFRQVVWAGSFEGETVLGVGTRAQLPFRTFLLNGPGRHETRLVIDVAHRW